MSTVGGANEAWMKSIPSKWEGEKISITKEITDTWMKSVTEKDDRPRVARGATNDGGINETRPAWSPSRRDTSGRGGPVKPRTAGGS